MPVKRLVWEHESDELVEDPRVGSDHYELQLREAEALGVSVAEALHPPDPWAQSCFWAWEQLATHSDWLFAFGASIALEVRNSDAVIVGGSMSRRMASKFSSETGVQRSALVSMETHSVADVEHADLLETVSGRFVNTTSEEDALLAGVRASYTVDRAFRGGLAASMAQLAPEHIDPS